MKAPAFTDLRLRKKAPTATEAMHKGKSLSVHSATRQSFTGRAKVIGHFLKVFRVSERNFARGLHAKPRGCESRRIVANELRPAPNVRTVSKGLRRSPPQVRCRGIATRRSNELA